MAGFRGDRLAELEGEGGANSEDMFSNDYANPWRDLEGKG